MASALPKLKHYPYERRSPRYSPYPEEHLAEVTKRVLIITIILFAVSVSLLCISGRMVEKAIQSQNLYFKEQTILKGRYTYLEQKLDDLTSPLAVEQIASSKNMKKPTAEEIQYLYLGSL